MARALVIYNPVAGGARGAAVSELAERRLRSAGFEVERQATVDRAGAAPLAAAAADRIDRVVSVGGDGTLREIVEGLGRERGRVEIGILPMGNANVVAHELGIPGETPQTLDLLIDGVPTPMDLGTVRTDSESSLFLAMVGVGWDADTVRLVDRLRTTGLGLRAYRFWADGLYAAAGLAAALRPGQARVSIRVDGEQMPLSTYRAAVFCNLRTYGKAMAVAPDAHRTSGRIHVQARKQAWPPSLALQLGAAVARVHTPPFVADYADGVRFEVEAERPFAVQVDGDARGTAHRLDVGVMPSAVRILGPPPENGRLAPTPA
jgi:diacylglycerol kinase (ATP)